MKCPCCNNQIEKVFVVQRTILRFPLEGSDKREISRRELKESFSSVFDLANLEIKCPICDLNLIDEIELTKG